MNHVEIICESCETRMRLSESLLERVMGKTGRVTCRQCSNKVVLDSRGDDLIVEAGGYLADAEFELEEVTHFSELPPTAELHLSEFPEAVISERPVGQVSLPPALPVEARLRRSRHAEASPALRELVEQVQRDKVFEFEAPSPGPMRAEEDSLSPQTMDDDEEGMIALGREFRSSPYAAERDITYNSLFPQPKQVAVEVVDTSPPSSVPAPLISRAPAPPKAGELRRVGSMQKMPRPAKTSVVIGPDGSLQNLADRQAEKKQKRGGVAPWVLGALAAAALLGLGVSVTTQPGGALGLASASKMKVEKASTQSVVNANLHEVEMKPEPQTSASEAVAASNTEASAATETPVVVEPVIASVVAIKKPSSIEKSQAADGPSEVATEGETAATATETVDADADAGDTDNQEAEVAPEEAAPASPPFDAAAAQVAMREATALASACRSPSDPSGVAQVVVVFAPSGRVTSASVSGAPFAGTVTGGCIASRFRGARVPAFGGERVTVTKTVTIQ